MKRHQNIFKSQLSRTEIITTLVSIFTSQQPLSPRQTQKLERLAPKLNPIIVDYALQTFETWEVAHRFFYWAQSQHGYVHNMSTFDTMAFILSNAQQKAPLKSLVTDLVKTRCPMLPQDLSSFIDWLGKEGLVDEAQWLFDQVKSKSLLSIPDCKSYSFLLDTVSNYFSVESLERILSEMRDLGWRPEKCTLAPMLLSYCKAGKFEKVMEVFNEMKMNGWLDELVLFRLAAEFSKQGQVDKAVEFIERMESDNVILDVKKLSSLICIFLSNGKTWMLSECDDGMVKALVLYDYIRKRGYTPDFNVCNSLIRRLCMNKKNYQTALSLYYDMKSLGICPDVEVLSQLISNSPGGKNTIKLLDEWEGDLGTEAATLLFNSVLESFIKCDSVDKSCHMLQEIIGGESQGEVRMDNLSKLTKHVLPNTKSFEIVIGGLCRDDKLDKAFDLFHEMDRIKCSRSRNIYCDLIGKSYSRPDRADEFYKLLTEMKEHGFHPAPIIYESAFGCCCKKGDATKALSIAKEMRLDGYDPWIKHSTVLVKKLCEDGKTTEAFEFLNSLLKEGVLPSSVPYSAAIDGFVKIHQVDTALELFRDIGSRGYCADVVAYNIIINGLCKARRVPEAQDIVNDMLVKGLIPTDVTCNSLIDGWCKIGDIDRAVVCFSNMVGKQWQPNVMACTTLIDGLCTAGRANDALSIWNVMSEKGCAPNRITYMAMIHGLCKCNMADVAVLFLNEMEEKELKPDTYIYSVLVLTFLSSPNQLSRMFKEGFYRQTSLNLDMKLWLDSTDK